MKHLNFFSLTPLLTKILLSISLVSFIISPSTWSSFLINHFHNYFISFPWQVVIHAIEKTYIFLLFNGILVFIAKTSTIFNPPSSTGDNFVGVLDKNYNEILEMENLVEISEPHKDDSTIEGDQNEEKIIREVYQDLKEDELENGNLLNEEIKEVFQQVEEKDYDNEESFNGLDHIIEVEEEEEVVEEDKAFALYEEKVEDLNTEELNKKFEEFIKKMKEELRIEAQQQLVLVK